MDNETLPLRDRLMIEIGQCYILSFGPSSMADAILPLIEAEREAAAKAALEAAAQDAEPWFPFDTNKKYKSFGVAGSIRAIDPAQFRCDHTAK